MDGLNQTLVGLERAIRDLACEISDNQKILQRIDQSERNIMSAISDFAAKQNSFNARVDAAVAGLTSDVEELTGKITELQNTPGAITPEDQALLDAIQSRSEGIATKLEALDSLTPPKPPGSITAS